MFTFVFLSPIIARYVSFQQVAQPTSYNMCYETSITRVDSFSHLNMESLFTVMKLMYPSDIFCVLIQLYPFVFVKYAFLVFPKQ